MTDRIIPEDLLQAVVSYIAAGSLSKSMTWAEMQNLIDRLQKLETVETTKPKLVEKS